MRKTKKMAIIMCTALSLSMVTPTVVPMMDTPVVVEAAKKVKLNKKKVSLTVGKTVKLKVTGTTSKVKWKSSKKKVATVNAKGKVTAKKKGKTFITATVKGKKYTCKVTVTKAQGQTTNDDAQAESTVPTTQTPTTQVPSDTTPSTPTTNNEPITQYDENGRLRSDVTCLEALIQKYQSKGAIVSSIMDGEDEYTWNEEGRLVAIDWTWKELSGEVSLDGLSALEEFICEENKITSLDLRDNTKLERLWCGGNALTSLDVTMLTELRDFTCGRNNLTSLDVSKNTKLADFSFAQNQISSIDITKLIKLEHFIGYKNKLTALDVSKNTQLIRLDCEHNAITALDVSKNTQLAVLRCIDNPITELNIQNNPKLQRQGAVDCDKDVTIIK